MHNGVAANSNIDAPRQKRSFPLLLFFDFHLWMWAKLISVPVFSPMNSSLVKSIFEHFILVSWFPTTRIPSPVKYTLLGMEFPFSLNQLLTRIPFLVLFTEYICLCPRRQHPHNIRKASQREIRIRARLTPKSFFSGGEQEEKMFIIIGPGFFSFQTIKPNKPPPPPPEKEGRKGFNSSLAEKCL